MSVLQKARALYLKTKRTKCENCGALIITSVLKRHQTESKICKAKPVPGWIYFFETHRKGTFKLGKSTTNVYRRLFADYKGWKEPKQLFFIRRVKDTYRAENMLRSFLLANGYQMLAYKNDWIKLRA